MDGRIFKITGVSRDDLLALFPDREREIEQLSDEDMESLASQMGNHYVECFWMQLRYMGEEMLDERRSGK